jgi:isoquinoline 1-oxidoreductase subunit alpha
MSVCGSFTLHVNADAVRSCVMPVSAVRGMEITTIGGSPLMAAIPSSAWMAEDVPQCGYCHSGQIMTAAALLAENSKPSDADIDDAMAGNICRCGTYQRIRRAIYRAAETVAEGGKTSEIINVSRRNFAKVGALVGGGLILDICLSFPNQRGQARAVASTPLALNALIRRSSVVFIEAKRPTRRDVNQEPQNYQSLTI